MVPSAQTILEASHFGALIDGLTRQGYEVLGPTLRDGVIACDRIRSVDDLPAGWTAEQQPGRYRALPRDDGAWFGYSVGPHSWKRFLHPPDVRLWSAERVNGTFRILPQAHRLDQKRAFLGIRACDLAAIRILDRILATDKDQDPIYTAHRADVFIVGVQCSSSAATCFCSSLGTGPSLHDGFDLALTELVGKGELHRFLIEAGSERGGEILSELPTRPAGDDDLARAAALREKATQQQRQLDAAAVRDALLRSFEHPRWDQVAARCLACANCTLACPTCFCTTVEDATSVSGDRADRWRRWDSCFTLSFSYIHGGSVRASTQARYRQWITHKLATWVDQFGTPGCVGCGRCITWCPVGIDITEEARAIQEGDNRGHP